MNNEELKRYYDMFTDSWRFFKKYANMKDTDEYWEAVIDTMHEVSKKYGKCKLITNLVLAVFTELQRISREEKENE